MSNNDYNFKDDFDFMDEWLRQKKSPKEDKKTLIQDTRTTRSMSTGNKAFNSKPVKKTKEDCVIYWLATSLFN